MDPDDDDAGKRCWSNDLEGASRDGAHHSWRGALSQGHGQFLGGSRVLGMDAGEGTGEGESI